MTVQGVSGRPVAAPCPARRPAAGCCCTVLGRSRPPRTRADGCAGAGRRRGRPRPAHGRRILCRTSPTTPVAACGRDDRCCATVAGRGSSSSPSARSRRWRRAGRSLPEALSAPEVPSRPGRPRWTRAATPRAGRVDSPRRVRSVGTLTPARRPPCSSAPRPPAPLLSHRHPEPRAVEHRAEDAVPAGDTSAPGRARPRRRRRAGPVPGCVRCARSPRPRARPRRGAARPRRPPRRPPPRAADDRADPVASRRQRRAPRAAGPPADGDDPVPARCARPPASAARRAAPRSSGRTRRCRRRPAGRASIRRSCAC